MVAMIFSAPCAASPWLHSPWLVLGRRDPFAWIRKHVPQLGYLILWQLLYVRSWGPTPSFGSGRTELQLVPTAPDLLLHPLNQLPLPSHLFLLTFSLFNPRIHLPNFSPLPIVSCHCQAFCPTPISNFPVPSHVGSGLALCWH